MKAATKAKSAPATEPAVPITFEEINQRRVRERIEAYREIVTRRATGVMLTVEDMERAGELLDLLGLPAYAFDRDTDAIIRHRQITAKMQSAEDAVATHRARAAEVSAEIEATRARLEVLREEHRRALAGVGKPGAYSNSVVMMENEHPHVLGDLDLAVRLRIEELDRRKQIGGAA